MVWSCMLMEMTDAWQAALHVLFLHTVSSVSQSRVLNESICQSVFAFVGLKHYISKAPL